MSTYWQLGLALYLGFVFHLKSSAQEPVTLITARITTVKESDWQREMAQTGKPDGMRERLQARTLVELAGAMTDDEVTLLSVGQERDFVTQWGRTANQQDVEAKKTEKQLIGTEMRVKREILDDDGTKVRLHITLTHDLQPPQLQKITYDTAAVGAERDRRSVTAPRFERLRWQGEVMARPEERMIASFQSPQDAATRIVVFLQGGAAASKAKESTTLQQTIYRVPELNMLDWLLKTSRDDAAVIHHLQEAVAAGQASVVSSTTLSMASRARAEAQIGTEHWVPTEMGQYVDQLYLVPSAFEPVLQGTRVSTDVSGCRATFNNSYALRPPLTVKWPTSWLRARDEKGAFTKAIHGWMDWRDRFEQQMDGSVFFCNAAPHLVAMMPPADQVWGTERQGRWLDVTVMQQPDWSAKPAPEDINEFVRGKEPAALPRRMFIGIALDSDAAHALLTERKPGQDDSALLHELLARTKDGKARVMTCVLAAHESDRRNQTSARMHAYPTEMPSIPSAWQDVPVGTRLEQDGDIVALTQHLAPPARSEWKLARDMPDAVMWQPRFRTMSTSTQAFAMISTGTHLLSAAAIPAVMADTDFPANETKTDDFESLKMDDFERFSQRQLKSGHAKLKSHSLLRTQPSPRVRLSVIEEYQTATAFDPPSSGAPFRMRPTALEALPVGLQFEGELTDEPDGTFHLNVKLQYSTAKPIEPGLEETLRLSANPKALYPGAKHELDEWTEGLSLVPGKFRRLLPPSSTTGDKTTTRSAWVRVRPAK
ncbi:MAG: hypothetical protein NTY98_10065 [Verrucomicrobia bacterium]|nr:hypothetical protein [Verrucomicrobiota bacterium]